MKPEWLNLPRRRCSNCGKTYKPKQPLRAGQEYSFCERKCKDQFHQHGGAYIKLKDDMAKLVERRLDELRADLKFIARDATAKAVKELVIDLSERRIREIVREELSAPRQSKPA